MIRGGNIRNTKQKEAILNIISCSYDHPTANSIYKKVRITIPNISLGTVYRNLNMLVEQKLIKRITMSDGIDRYDKASLKHNHFICTSCHKIFDLNNEVSINKNIGNHQVIDYEIKFTGICEECLNMRGR